MSNPSNNFMKALSFILIIILLTSCDFAGEQTDGSTSSTVDQTDSNINSIPTLRKSQKNTDGSNDGLFDQNKSTSPPNIAATKPDKIVDTKKSDFTVGEIRELLVSDLLKDELTLFDKTTGFHLDKHDLNNDGSTEYIILFMGNYFCGTGGCITYILNNDGSLFSKLTRITTPFYVLDHINKGYKDLLMYHSVTDVVNYEKIRYNGKKYQRKEAKYQREDIGKSFHKLFEKYNFDEYDGRVNFYKDANSVLRKTTIGELMQEEEKLIAQSKAEIFDAFNSGAGSENQNSKDAVTENTAPKAITKLQDTQTDDKLEPKFIAIIRNYLQNIYPQPRYDYSKIRFHGVTIDLNNDGIDEYIAYLNGSYFCGSGGCNSVIMKNNGKIISKIKRTRPPFWLTDTRTNNYHDMVYIETGGGIKGGKKVLRYKKSNYHKQAGYYKGEPTKNWKKLLDSSVSFFNGYRLTTP